MGRTHRSIVSKRDKEQVDVMVAGTIILAAIFLRERMTALQIFGLVLALASASMLALV